MSLDLFYSLKLNIYIYIYIYWSIVFVYRTPIAQRSSIKASTYLQSLLWVCKVRIQGSVIYVWYSPLYPALFLFCCLCICQFNDTYTWDVPYNWVPFHFQYFLRYATRKGGKLIQRTLRKVDTLYQSEKCSHHNMLQEKKLFTLTVWVLKKLYFILLWQLYKFEKKVAHKFIWMV